jgi:nitric oxide reductase subunit C
MSSEAHEGRVLYQELNCSSCHQIFGLGGYLGPELTNVISTEGKGKAYVAAFLNYGPGQMPDFHLDSLQTRKIIAYLSYIDSSDVMERSVRSAAN